MSPSAIALQPNNDICNEFQTPRDYAVCCPDEFTAACLKGAPLVMFALTACVHAFACALIGCEGLLNKQVTPLLKGSSPKCWSSRNQLATAMDADFALNAAPPRLPGIIAKCQSVTALQYDRGHSQ